MIIRTSVEMQHISVVLRCLLRCKSCRQYFATTLDLAEHKPSCKGTAKASRKKTRKGAGALHGQQQRIAAPRAPSKRKLRNCAPPRSVRAESIEDCFVEVPVSLSRNVNNAEAAMTVVKPESREVDDVKELSPERHSATVHALQERQQSEQRPNTGVDSSARSPCSVTDSPISESSLSPPREIDVSQLPPPQIICDSRSLPPPPRAASSTSRSVSPCSLPPPPEYSEPTVGELSSEDPKLYEKSARQLLQAMRKLMVKEHRRAESRVEADSVGKASLVQNSQHHGELPSTHMRFAAPRTEGPSTMADSTALSEIPDSRPANQSYSGELPLLQNASQVSDTMSTRVDPQILDLFQQTVLEMPADTTAQFEPQKPTKRLPSDEIQPPPYIPKRKTNVKNTQRRSGPARPMQSTTDDPNPLRIGRLPDELAGDAVDSTASVGFDRALCQLSAGVSGHRRAHSGSMVWFYFVQYGRFL